MTAMTWMNFKNTALRENSQAQETTYCDSINMKLQKMQIDSNRMISSYLGMGLGTNSKYGMRDLTG